MSETMAASAGVSQTPVLHLDSIRKSFGSTTVLNGISFDVNQHEVVALLGQVDVDEMREPAGARR